MSELSKEIRKKYREFSAKNGREPDKRERRRIRNRVKRVYNMKRLYRGIALALGISSIVGGTKLLTSGDTQSKAAVETEAQNKNDNNEIKIEGTDKVVTIENDELNNERKSDTIVDTEERKEDFLAELRAGVAAEENIIVNTENEQSISNDEIVDEIIKEYNEKNGTDINENEFSYMKTSNLTYIGIDENGRYVRDYKEQTPVEGYSMDPYAINTTIYTMVDLKNGKIIGAIGRVDGDIHDIYTNVIKSGKGKEYVHAENEINLTEISLNDEKLGGKSKKDAVYNAIQEETEKVIHPEKSKDDDEGR